MRIRTLCALSLTTTLAVACASPLDAWDRNAGGWIGSSFAKLVAVYGEPASSKVDPSGNRLMRYELREIDPGCVQTWVVDKNDVIVSQFHNKYCQR